MIMKKSSFAPYFNSSTFELTSQAYHFTGTNVRVYFPLTVNIKCFHFTFIEHPYYYTICTAFRGYEK